MVLADMLLIWCCWIVWNRRLRVVAVPIILLLRCIAMIIMLLRAMAFSSESAKGIFAASITPWISTVLAVTLLQNLLVTSLIVLRTWRINSIVSRSTGTSTLQPIIAMIVESGLLYVLVLFIWLMAYVARSNSE